MTTEKTAENGKPLGEWLLNIKDQDSMRRTTLLTKSLDDVQVVEQQASPESTHSTSSEARVLPDDGKVREQYPLYDGLFAYFPAALCEIARWSQVGGSKHHPGEPLHWAREKSTDHQNKILRHLLDYDQEDEHGFIEAIALAWRALALAQTELEKRGWAEGRNGKWKR
jgi:hypothetical protein